jgi:hypothetical protein
MVLAAAPTAHTTAGASIYIEDEEYANKETLNVDLMRRMLAAPQQEIDARCSHYLQHWGIDADWGALRGRYVTTFYTSAATFTGIRVRSTGKKFKLLVRGYGTASGGTVVVTIDGITATATVTGVAAPATYVNGWYTATAATANIFGDFPTTATDAYSFATTDEFGFAMLTVIKMAAPCEAVAAVIPDSKSRYQSRSLSLTIDEDTDHVVVLKIPSPEIVSGSVKTVGSTRTMTVLGNNFLGTYAVSWNGIQVTNFTVVNNTTLSFNLDSGALDYGSVNVENGGGSVTAEVGVLR